MLAEHYYGTGPGGDAGPDLAALLDLMARARPKWQADALCTEYPGVDFFDPKDTAAAVAICRRCSVAAECGSYARQNGEAAGVWAGVALDPPRRPQRLRARIVSDGAPARLREVGLVETRLPVSPSSVAVLPTGDTSPMGDSVSTFVEPAPVRRVEHRALPNWGNDDRPPAPSSCARCPMATKSGRELCKGCERDAG